MYFITIFNEPVVKGYACYDTFLSMLVVEMKDLSSLIDYVTMKRKKKLCTCETIRLSL